MPENEKIKDALLILDALGLPQKQKNIRSARCLLALINLSPEKVWAQAENPPVGITPIMEFIGNNYGKKYAPNTRETVRKHSVQLFVEAGIATLNPDRPGRPPNSKDTVYQILPETLALLKTYGTEEWENSLSQYLSIRETLAQRYAKEREQNMVPVQFTSGKEIKISPGKHSELIKAIIEDFAPRFAPGAILVYVGDTGKKWGYFDKGLLTKLGVTVDKHGKMPDVVLYYPEKIWLLLVESVTSSGPVDGKRHSEPARLFAGAKAGIVYVTAFPSRSMMARYLGELSWETEVWVADAPSHLIHFNGPRFLGPYNDNIK